MDRRTVIRGLALIGFSAPLAAEAQPAGRMPRIGWLSPEAPPPPAFAQGMRDLGYVEGQTVAVESRLAGGKLDRLPELAAELVRLNVDVIVANGYPAILAGKQATANIPIVFATHVDPVGTRLVASIAHPIGNVTGFTMMAPALAGKRLQLLQEIAPRASSVAVLTNTANPGFEPTLQQMLDAAQVLQLKLQILEVRAVSEFDQIAPALKARRAAAMHVNLDPLFLQNRTRITGFAAEARLPAMYDLREFADAGGLISYGPSFAEIWRGVAVYVDRILKGAKPADLPIQQPTKFELVINLKTAKALGLTIPQSVLVRADEVIQ